jgi:hypothetical protein
MLAFRNAQQLDVGPGNSQFVKSAVRFLAHDLASERSNDACLRRRVRHGATARSQELRLFAKEMVPVKGRLAGKRHLDLRDRLRGSCYHVPIT